MSRACAQHIFFHLTWPRQVHRKFLFHSSRAKSQQRHAIAQPCRFAHIMRDEDDGAAGFRPYALQFIVQQIASLGVERGERLVHQQDVRLGGQARAKATRCRMPPES